MSKPYSESCEQNRAPILSVLSKRLSNAKNLLEIGSGTGQHAVYFAPELPDLHWQTSDCPEYHPAIHAWLDDAVISNIAYPLSLNVLVHEWPTVHYDAVFSANTVHIMDRAAVIALFSGVGSVLKKGAEFILYGPFNYDGRYTSESNARFDQWLLQRGEGSCIKDFEWLNELAAANGLSLVDDIEMPANNRILVWVKA